jgi:hypothetical protein
MKIVIKYASSEGPHMMDFTQMDIRQAYQSGELVIVSENPAKTLTISGDPAEFYELANALNQAMS